VSTKKTISVPAREQREVVVPRDAARSAGSERVQAGNSRCGPTRWKRPPPGKDPPMRQSRSQGSIVCRSLVIMAEDVLTGEIFRRCRTWPAGSPCHLSPRRETPRTGAKDHTQRTRGLGYEFTARTLVAHPLFEIVWAITSDRSFCRPRPQRCKQFLFRFGAVTVHREISGK